jgi:hypothetical protein
MTLINLLPVGKAIKFVKAIPAVVRAVEKIVTFVATKGKKLPVAAPPGCFRSFAGSTPVLMADGTHRPIEDIEVDDHVIATDPETGEQAAKAVTDVWVHQDDLFEFEIDGEPVVATDDHPFWSVTDQMWKVTQDLTRGERVLAADGRTPTVTREIATDTREIGLAYNLAVSGLHTYHVSSNDILVHNTGDGPVGEVFRDGSYRFQIFSNDHAPAHGHLQGPGIKGHGIQIGQNGKPLDPDVTLTAAQQRVIDDNLGTIRKAIQNYMKWYKKNLGCR